MENPVAQIIENVVQNNNSSPSVFLFRKIFKFTGNILTNRIFIILLLVAIMGTLIYFIYKKSNKSSDAPNPSNSVSIEPVETKPKRIIINHPNHPNNTEQDSVVASNIDLPSSANTIEPLNIEQHTLALADYSNDNERLLYDDNKKSYTEELNDIVDMLDNDKINTIQAFEKSQELEPEIVGQHNLTNSEIMEINKKLEEI